MKQLHITATHPDHTFAFTDVVPPVPGDNQLLIEMAATSINPADWKFAGSDMAPLPFAVGLDVAGTVSVIGATVDGFTVGDRVVAQASMGTGTFAPLTLTRARSTATLPDAVSFTDAATLGTAGQAAHAAIVDEADVSEGQSVLIHGASGGVGTFAVQIARYRGAHVIATASSRNHALLRNLGANEVIDYTTTRFEDAVQEVDVVLDTVGGDTFTRSLDVLRTGGTLVSIAHFDEPPEDVVGRNRLTVRQISMQPKRDRLTTLADLISTGAIQPVIGDQVSIDDAITAFRQSMDRHNRGNVVVTLTS